MIRALARLAITYAVTRMIARAGGRGGVLDAVLGKGKRKGAHHAPPRGARRGRH